MLITWVRGWVLVWAAELNSSRAETRCVTESCSKRAQLSCSVSIFLFLPTICISIYFYSVYHSFTAWYDYITPAGGGREEREWYLGSICR